MTRSSPRCFAMKAAFKSEVPVQELIGAVGKSTTHPPCQKIGLELRVLEVGMHRSFVLPHMARPRLPPMSRPTGAMKRNKGYPGVRSPLLFSGCPKASVLCFRHVYGSTDQIRDPCGKGASNEPLWVPI
jgi:hypothetical protein